MEKSEDYLTKLKRNLDRSLRRSELARQKKLLKQRNEGAKMIGQAIIRLRKKRKHSCTTELKKIRTKIVPFLIKYKWLPTSYKTMLSAWIKGSRGRNDLSPIKDNQLYAEEGLHFFNKRQKKVRKNPG